jgi:steroid 5-alpha reductase family enzyme
MDAAPRWDRTDSFGLVALAYVVALAAAVGAGAVTPLDHGLGLVLVADVVATVAVFAFSIRLGNGSVYDPYWSVAPPVIALYWLGVATHATWARQALVVPLVVLWAMRLTWNWARGWAGLAQEDWRYTMLYERAPLPRWAISLLGIHLFPTLQVWLGCLALAPALGWGDRPLGPLDAVAVLVTGGAILLETIADEQMRAFARTKAPGDLMARGLWARSRHPNYLGEIGFWTGLALFGLAADPWWWWSLAGPIAMIAMFVGASIPMLDARSIARRPGYADYMRRVPALLPRTRVESDTAPLTPPR